MDPPLEDAVVDELLVLLVVVGVYCVYSEGEWEAGRGKKKHDICRAMKKRQAPWYFSTRRAGVKGFASTAV